MNAANDFEKYFFKLMIDSAYGKTTENLWKRINVRLINNTEDFLKYTSKPTYITHKSLGEDYAAVHEFKPSLILNKLIYVGFTVLELSKWKMYGFYFHFIKKKFDAKLLFTDTDSLTNEINSENAHEEFLRGKICLTLVIIQKIQSFLNKKVIGKMKDEFGVVIVTEFVGLKSKM